MVQDAPAFADIAQEASWAQLSAKLFVAHNARFDYGFRAEFKRAGLTISASALYRQLSRKLFRCAAQPGQCGGRTWPECEQPSPRHE